MLDLGWGFRPTDIPDFCFRSFVRQVQSLQLRVWALGGEFGRRVVELGVGAFPFFGLCWLDGLGPPSPKP